VAPSQGSVGGHTERCLVLGCVFVENRTPARTEHQLALLNKERVALLNKERGGTAPGDMLPASWRSTMQRSASTGVEAVGRRCRRTNAFRLTRVVRHNHRRTDPVGAAVEAQAPQEAPAPRTAHSLPFRKQRGTNAGHRAGLVKQHWAVGRAATEGKSGWVDPKVGPKAQAEGGWTHLRGVGTAPRGSPLSVFSKYLTYLCGPHQEHEHRGKSRES